MKFRILLSNTAILVMCVVLLFLIIFPGDKVAATRYTQTFNYTGGVQVFTVPSGIYKITINTKGAAGGREDNNPGGSCCTGWGSNYGGYGGVAEGTFNVSPGEVFYVYVGGYGGQSGGWNGGGSAGPRLPQDNEYNGWQGGGGGGASDVRRGGQSLSNRIVVGGGGGGGGGQSPGKGGGGLEGNCHNVGGNCLVGGGSQASGGNGGSANPCTVSSPCNGTNGTLGAGGNGGRGGGGGGGGYYGGGGGSAPNCAYLHTAACPGGGGSGFVHTSASNPSLVTGNNGGTQSQGGSTSHGRVDITYETQPTVDLKVSTDNITYSDEPVEVSIGQELYLKWATTETPSGCTATMQQGDSNFWAESKDPAGGQASGSELTQGQRVYKIECSNPGGTATDTVAVDVLGSENRVRFQLASSDSPFPSSGWLFRGPDCSADTWYESDPGQLMLGICPQDKNRRYIRYKVKLQSATSTTPSPEVDRVIFKFLE